MFTRRRHSFLFFQLLFLLLWGPLVLAGQGSVATMQNPLQKQPAGKTNPVQQVIDLLQRHQHGYLLSDKKGKLLTLSGLASPPGRGELQVASKQPACQLSAEIGDENCDISEELLVREPLPDEAALKRLNSREGASKVLYLNFWGGTLTGSIWNSDLYPDILYAPFSMNATEEAPTPTGEDCASPETSCNFSEEERYTILLAWQEVKEDFAPFDINVTTDKEKYEHAESANRAMIIITPSTEWYGGGADNYRPGGASFNNTFGDDYEGISWVWNKCPNNLGPTISHEAGHMLGLHHDGLEEEDGTSTPYYAGNTHWGPIMGAPFGKSYVQWSRGEYPGANNQEDDLRIIANQLGLVEDDAGNTAGEATPLLLGTFEQEHLITPAGLYDDPDVFTFSLAIPAHVRLLVAPVLGAAQKPYGTNLSLQASLTSNGTELQGADPAGVPATNRMDFDATLQPGQYLLTIRGQSPSLDWSTDGFSEYGNGGFYMLKMALADPQPDLIIERLQVDQPTFCPAGDLNVTIHVTNQGTGTASLFGQPDPGPLQVHLFIRANEEQEWSLADTEPPEDNPLELDEDLDAGQSKAISTRIQAPPQPGVYLVRACAIELADEFDTTNNCSEEMEVAVAPDLVFLPPEQAGPENVLAGTPFITELTLRNQGTVSAENSPVNIYISTDNLLESTDQRLATLDMTDSLAPGAQIRIDHQVPLPSQTGHFWIGGCVEPVENEFDTTNNCSQGLEIELTAPDIQPVQLTAEQNDLQQGDTLNLTLQITNQGNGPAQASSIHFFLRKNTPDNPTPDDYAIGSAVMESLESGASLQVPLVAAIHTPAGNYRLIACVDPPPGEVAVDNNCLTGPAITITQTPGGHTDHPFPWNLFYPAILRHHQATGHPGQ